MGSFFNQTRFIWLVEDLIGMHNHHLQGEVTWCKNVGGCGVQLNKLEKKLWEKLFSMRIRSYVYA